MTKPDPLPGLIRAPVVPELLVTDLDASLRFWRDLCGFGVAYDRPEDRFAYLDRAGSQVMLEEVMEPGRRWITGVLQRPFGRGVNFQIAVADVTPILDALRSARWPLFLDVEEVRYRVGATAIVVRQFLVQDPDGYLLRFSQELGHAAASTTAS